MGPATSFTINIDGAARGNPGPAAFAFVIEADGKLHTEESGCLEPTTNNIAEYTALVRALKRAAELGGKKLLIRSDSELLVKQMNGLYRVKNPHLRLLHDEAQELVRKFDSVELIHIPRSQNSHPDRLCNQALDGSKAGDKRPAAHRTKSQHDAKKLAPEGAVRDDALVWLRWAAGQWANGNPETPSPEDVWDHLWTILEDHGAVRAKS
jgi:ribonuclease HI